ncbi:serine hydroxymethyltransferase [Haladaptatus pallidirubidus]|uniref:serine hydroxymethyltransferase n=1 Tax=Haladaptatus pallidirubidus TaxID=1008152 RepID=UPI001D0F887C|nr:serine hydroxymethyltransferase [Haladaptatus pallidirubidus]
MNSDPIRAVSEDLADALDAEETTQRNGLLMIASENHVSPAVMAAQGSVLTNRNALGYPDDRLYPASQDIDTVEQLAIDYAKELWGADHVNVQPHSGSLANLAVYLAVLEPNDRILALDPIDGGHITHGDTRHISGKQHETEFYHANPETGRVDYDDLQTRAEEFDPDLIISGYSAYPREVNWERVQAAADAVDAYHLADIAHLSGLIAADQLASPVGIADFATGSTYKTIRAGRGGVILCDEMYADAIDAAVFPGSQGGAAMPMIAGKAAGFAEALTPEFDSYAEQLVTNARTLAQTLAERGIHVVSGGTDTHIVLIDLRQSHPDLTGSEAEAKLEAAGIYVTKATVPGETRPNEASGIRIGTPALTSRGFEEEEMKKVAELINHVLNDDDLENVQTEIAVLCEENPLDE